MNKIGTAALVLVASTLVMISFQNCGKITLADAVSANSAKLAGASVSTPDSLIIDIKSPTSPLIPSEPIPAVTPDRVKNPAVGTTTPIPADPEAGNVTSSVVPAAAIDRCKVSLDDQNVDHDTDSDNFEENRHLKHAKHIRKHEGKDEDRDENENEIALSCEAAEPKELSKEKNTHCGNFIIQDILLSIRSATFFTGIADDNLDDDFKIIDSDKTISLNKTHLKLKANHDKTIKELFLGLNAEGNKVLNKDLRVVNLKPAFSKGAGFKVELENEATVKEGHEYSLRLTIEQEDQVVENPAQCLFKPVIKVAILEED